MSDRGRRAEGSVDMAAAECIEAGSELQEGRPPSLIEECESLCRTLGGMALGEYRMGSNVSGGWSPPNEDSRRILRIVETRSGNCEEARWKKLAMEVFAERYGDPSDIWIIVLKNACAELDLAASREF